jgi:hypothetical protein
MRPTVRQPLPQIPYTMLRNLLVVRIAINLCRRWTQDTGGHVTPRFKSIDKYESAPTYGGDLGNANLRYHPENTTSH